MRVKREKKGVLRYMIEKRRYVDCWKWDDKSWKINKLLGM